MGKDIHILVNGISRVTCPHGLNRPWSDVTYISSESTSGNYFTKTIDIGPLG